MNFFSWMRFLIVYMFTKIVYWVPQYGTKSEIVPLPYSLPPLSLSHSPSHPPSLPPSTYHQFPHLLLLRPVYLRGGGRGARRAAVLGRGELGVLKQTLLHQGHHLLVTVQLIRHQLREEREEGLALLLLAALRSLQLVRWGRQQAAARMDGVRWVLETGSDVDDCWRDQITNRRDQTAADGRGRTADRWGQTAGGVVRLCKRAGKEVNGAKPLGFWSH